MKNKTTTLRLLDQYQKMSLRPDYQYSGLPSWHRQIIDKFPVIYRSMGRHDSESGRVQTHHDDYCSLRSGFECGPGWEGLIERLSSVAAQLIIRLRDSGLQCDAFIQPSVIKQKFGALGWNGRHNLVSPFNQLWSAYLSQTQRESTRTCELSGEPGTMRTIGGGFVICLSDKEHREWKRSPLKQRLRYMSA